MKNTVVFPPQSRVPVRLICCCCYCYYLIIVIKKSTVQQRNSCVIISLTSYCLPHVFVCSHIVFYLRSKKFFSPIMTLQSFISTVGSKCMHYFQLIKQKDYSLPENLDQLINLHIGCVPVLFLLINISPS